MQQIAIDETYKAISSTTGWVIQNVGKHRVYLFITDGTAPVSELGYILDPGMILRDVDLGIAGTVYGKTAKGQQSSVVVNS